MYNYKITPKQPLIFRDAKPFGTDDNIADTLAFPLPSTLAGALRTAWADSAGKDYSNPDDIKTIKKKSVCGPILTCSSKNETRLMFPAPADSVCIKPKDSAKDAAIYRLKPEKLGDEIEEGLNDLIKKNLSPVFMQKTIKGKPAKDAPGFWYQEKMVDWLKSDNSDELSPQGFGIQSLPRDIRTHVAIKSETGTAKAGHLFQTAGLDFGQNRKQSSGNEAKNWGWEKSEYGLACQFQESIPETLRTIGGESRLGLIETGDSSIWDCPAELITKIHKHKAFRLVLVTPAIFKQGHIPDWINPETMMSKDSYRGMTLRLHAIAVSRWQAGSSWDMASPKSKSGKGMRAIKRLTPVGTVYWFEIINGQIDAEGFWLTSISDVPNDKESREYCRFNDGYGLTLPGVWNIPENMKERKG